MVKRITALLIMVAICISGYAAVWMIDGGGNVTSQTSEIPQQESVTLQLDLLDAESKKFATQEFVDWIKSEFGPDAIKKLHNLLLSGEMSVDRWYDITGNSAIVLQDMYSGALDPNSPNYRSDIRVIETDREDTVIRIVGDVSFADNWKIAPKLDQRKKGIYGVLSEKTVSLLRDADVFLLNNEFTYSNRGKPLANKYYTFRAAPERVEHLKEMGADIVSLANNHAYDYGADAFADTLQTLKKAGIPYIGGGKDASEAAKPFYFIVNGRKYAFSAATKAEKFILTPEAKENSSGVMRTYDPTKYLKVVRVAEQQCDYNIVYLHWGTEGSHKIADGQYEMAKQFINAGADIVVGAHAHVLQGIQYYKDVPIVYNLGNFIFNAKTMDSGILEISISKQGSPSYRFLPAIQKDCYTRVVEGEEKARILKFMKELSVGVTFDQNGAFKKANS